MTEQATEYRTEQYVKQYIIVCKNGLSVDCPYRRLKYQIFSNLFHYHYIIIKYFSSPLFR